MLHVACQSCSQILVLFQWAVMRLMVSTVETPYLSGCQFKLHVNFYKLHFHVN